MFFVFEFYFMCLNSTLMTKNNNKSGKELSLFSTEYLMTGGNRVLRIFKLNFIQYLCHSKFS